MFKIPKKPQSDILAIVNSSCIGHSNVADGKMLPHLTVYLEKHPNIKRSIELQSTTRSGDVKTTWATAALDKNLVYIKFEFLKPVQNEFLVGFDKKIDAPTIDLIIRRRALYLSTECPSRERIESYFENSLIIEVTAPFPEKNWERTYIRITREKLRSRGVPRHEAKRLALKSIETARLCTDQRAG